MRRGGAPPPVHIRSILGGVPAGARCCARGVPAAIVPASAGVKGDAVVIQAGGGNDGDQPVPLGGGRRMACGVARKRAGYCDDSRTLPLRDW